MGWWCSDLGHVFPQDPPGHVLRPAGTGPDQLRPAADYGFRPLWRPRSVFGKQAILDAIAEGAITIAPFCAERIGPASVDLTLASTFRVFRKV
ncbi:MAG: dCTP deaminase domain-containing protein, partial [Cyanobium sp.]